jgi:hypothetical protein
MTETKELQMLPTEWQKLAETKSVEIFQKINATTERIRKAKQEADLAKAMKSGWFGKTGKKADATANAVVTTNAALSEMNTLLQESIKFTCISIDLAKAMYKTMAYMMVNGFKDSNGRIIQLSNDSKEAVQLILDEADDFVKKQLAVEEKQAEMHRRLDKKDKIDEEQNQRLETLKTTFENERERINKAFNKKDKIDEEQENEIRLLVEYTKQKDVWDKEQSEHIQKIMDELKSGVTRKKRGGCFSIIALIISAGTLVFSILRIYLQ